MTTYNILLPVFVILIVNINFICSARTDTAVGCLKLLKSAEQCCKMPKLIPTSMWDMCKNKNIAETTELQEHNIPQCRLDCVFRNQSLYNVDFSLNTDKIKNFMAKDADEIWTKLIDLAIDECVIGVASMLPTSEQRGACNLTANLFTLCVQRNMFLACPDIYKFKVNSSICNEALVEKTRICDPYKTPLSLRKKTSA